MYYKEDWPQAKQRLEAFWQHQIVDRCCVAVFAPRKTSTLPPFPELQWGPWLGGLEDYADDDETAIRRWWTDPEANYRRMLLWFENTYFGGEAIPATYINWGASAGAALWGAQPRFNKTSVWYPTVIEDWETWRWHSDPATNEWWQQIMAIQRHFIDQNHGRYFVGTPEIGGAADLLSLLRGMDQLAIDLISNPDEVKRAVSVMTELWVSLHEDLYQMTYAANDRGGVLPWMSLWAPGRHDQIANDFSSVISTRMFREFFLPEIVAMGEWCDYGTYHLDGQKCITTHLDFLLSIDQINNIEFTPGSGQPPTYSPQYIPLYKKIQASGKNLYLLVRPAEIEPLLSELAPEGLFLCTDAPSEEEADRLLANVARWSARGHQFPVGM